MEKDLERKLQELEDKIALLEKQQIKIVGEFNGTTVPVTINGVSRRITTSAP